MYIRIYGYICYGLDSLSHFKNIQFVHIEQIWYGIGYPICSHWKDHNGYQYT